MIPRMPGGHILLTGPADSVPDAPVLPERVRYLDSDSGPGPS